MFSCYFCACSFICYTSLFVHSKWKLQRWSYVYVCLCLCIVIVPFFVEFCYYCYWCCHAVAATAATTSIFIALYQYTLCIVYALSKWKAGDIVTKYSINPFLFDSVFIHFYNNEVHSNFVVVIRCLSANENCWRKWMQLCAKFSFSATP